MHESFTHLIYVNQLCCTFGLGARAISIRVLAGNDVEMLIILAKTIMETALGHKPYMLSSWFASLKMHESHEPVL